MMIPAANDKGGTCVPPLVHRLDYEGFLLDAFS